MTDDCLNSSTWVQTITIDDTTPPVITSGPADITYECIGDVPAADIALITATDNCDTELDITFADVSNVITSYSIHYTKLYDGIHGIAGGTR